MTTPIPPISAPVAPALTAAKAAVSSQGGAAGFASILSDAVGRMDQSNKVAQGAIDSFMSGENEEIHNVVMATQRTELQFELFLQVRNKIVQAYQEVMRMQM